jgi:hypothetical protein
MAEKLSFMVNLLLEKVKVKVLKRDLTPFSFKTIKAIVL